MSKMIACKVCVVYSVTNLQILSVVFSMIHPLRPVTLRSRERCLWYPAALVVREFGEFQRLHVCQSFASGSPRRLTLVPLLFSPFASAAPIDQVNKHGKNEDRPDSRRNRDVEILLVPCGEGDKGATGITCAGAACSSITTGGTVNQIGRQCHAFARLCWIDTGDLT